MIEMISLEAGYAQLTYIVPTSIRLSFLAEVLEVRVGHLEHLVIALDEVELDILLHIVGQPVHVSLVGLGEDKRGEALPHRRHRLLLHAADFEHFAVQGNLAGHTQALQAGLVQGQADQRRCDGHTGGRTVLGCGTLWEVNVDVGVFDVVEGVWPLVGEVLMQERLGVGLSDG